MTDLAFSLAANKAPGGIAPLRGDIKECIKRYGFQRNAYRSYTSPISLDDKIIVAILTELEKIQNKHNPAKIVALKMADNLNMCEIRTSKYRGA